ncbi:ABC-type transport system involved in multi-copper enzyme maturation, permease component [Actinacidiphila alni]|uniref:ABC-type transport system involved in multi-copper enzyme maturation, permease component n=1 Tax=Actinacidiphila alni TaxID=380248 RepID=A0A1I2K690_9ACTN|nr:ABC transporter permease [Actinacidiphila alni]SFF60717.1 ABC-type transport system involved in multi-copper enzyme maturation, permease component [Actinacidiphila alni]
MSTLTLDRAPEARRAEPRGQVTFARVLRSEWIKMRTLRSTFWTMLAAVVALIGFGILFGAVDANRWPHMSAHEKATFDPIGTSLQGFFLAQLAIGVLGVLMISGEYATGMIRASLSAVPRRLPVLWAKAGLYAVVTWVLMTAGSLIAFLSGQALLSSRHIGASLSDPGAVRMVLGTGLYLTVVALLGVAVGALVRNTAGGIATVFGLLLVLPALAEALPSSWADHINQYLPSNAGQSLTALHHEAHTLAPWPGFLVFCAYAVAALAGAAVLLKRHDA